MSRRHVEAAGADRQARNVDGELAARGFGIQTLNFFDDNTHLATPEWAEVAALLTEAGFAVVEGGEISLGLLAEEVDPETGALLGNFPQAFSHIGLVNAAWAIREAIQHSDV